MGVIVEKFHDDKGIVWPKEVAPFDIHLVELPGAKGVEELYKKLTDAGLDVLWDDREVPAGQKFADADLIGVPVRLVMSEKTGDQIEYKERNSSESQLFTENTLLGKVGQ
jgi:prolyl-tRNA synthetase